MEWIDFTDNNYVLIMGTNFSVLRLQNYTKTILLLLTWAGSVDIVK